jgi:DNA-directed RNA polymerase subunit M/transcription elongation factor TFIIS
MIRGIEMGSPQIGVKYDTLNPLSSVDSTMRFCSVCSYYLYLVMAADGSTLTLSCKHCGFTEPMNPKTSEEALVLETTFSSSTGQKQTVSSLTAYTKLDPTLPHLKTIPCPNEACPSGADPERRDILYIKTDPKNLKFQYSCTVCNTQWAS